MTPENIVDVLYYYLAFWIFNSAAYAVVSFGMRKWLKFMKGLEAERALRTSLKVTMTVGFIRFTIGSIGFILYANGSISPLSTIILLGISSLLLNTLFIMGEGIVLNREAKLAWNVPASQRELLLRAISSFEALRHTVKNA